MSFFSGFFGKLLEGAAVVGLSAALGPEVGVAFGDIGAAAGGAIVGGVAGAGIAAATGQNVLEGGALGAIGGYSSPGVASALGGSSTTDITAATADAASSKAAQAAASTVSSSSVGQAVDISDASSLLTSGGAGDSINAVDVSGSAGGAAASTLTGSSVAPSATAGTSGLSGFFSKISPSSYLTAGASVINAGVSAMGSARTAKATSDIGTAPTTPENNASDQLLVDQENDALRTRRGLASNILTNPTGSSRGGMSASQMLLA